MKFKNIETTDLVIRLLKKSDVEDIFRLSQESSLAKWIPDQVYRSINEAEEVITFLTSLYSKPISPVTRPFVIGVELKGNKELIGHVGLSPLEGKVEVGYAISENYVNQGLATQAVSAVSNWVLTSSELKEIFGVVACENIGSSRVLEKSGYKLVKEHNRNYLGKVRLCREFKFSLNS